MIRYLTIGLFLFSGVAHAGIFPCHYRSTICCMMAILVANDATTVPSLIEAQADEAARFLRDFRRNTLRHDSATEPHAEPIRARDQLLARYINNVGNRIRGIEIDSFLSGGRVKKKDEVFGPISRSGIIIRGKQNIERALAAMEMVQQMALDTYVLEDMPSLKANDIHKILARFGAISAAFPLVSSDPASYVIAGWGMVNLGQQAVGAYRQNDLTFAGHQKRIRTFLETEAPSVQWFYDADTFPLDKKEWRKFRKLDLNAVEKADPDVLRILRILTQNFTSESWRRALPVIDAIAEMWAEGEQEVTWVSWDRLVTRDETDVPVMVLYLRYSDNRPIYRKAKASATAPDHAAKIIPQVSPQ